MPSRILNLAVLTLFSTYIQLSKSDEASDQLLGWSNAHPKEKGETATDFRGCPVPSLTASQSVGRNYGPVLLADSHLLESLGRFVRERIPERPLHAKGSGAFGYFEVNHDITKYTKAKIFNKIGKKTPVVVRFSLATGELGSEDMLQAGRGFAVKFKTEDGNFDIVGRSLENFPIKEPILFPEVFRSRKRNPRTHLKDPNMKWDFNSLRPESIFDILLEQSALGRPDGYRHMHGYGVHAFKLINHEGQVVYCKFHWRTEQGLRNLTGEQNKKLNGIHLDYSGEDLYNAIAGGQFPAWKLYIQVMTYKQAAEYRWNAFDPTKQWLQSEFPLIPVGRMVLNRNPTNYFTQVEMIGFDPGNLVPGIDVSPDKLLHGRTFAYQDAQRYRLGGNRGLVTVNAPSTGAKVRNYNRDGAGVHSAEQNGGGAPNYFPNSFDGIKVEPDLTTPEHLDADVERYDVVDEDNYSQATYYWKNMLSDAEKSDTATCIASSLKGVYKSTLKRMMSHFRKVSKELAGMVAAAMADARQ